MGTTSSIIITISAITGLSIVTGIFVYIRYKKGKNRKDKPEKKQPKKEDKKMNDYQKIENKDNNADELNSILLTDNSETSFNNELCEISNNSSFHLINQKESEFELDKPNIEIKTNSSKSSSSVFSHNYEGKIILQDTYKINKFIGKGSIGKVYSGINLKTGKEDIAIKIIDIKNNANIEGMAIREIEIMKEFSNLENAVKLINNDRINDDLIIVMEKCDKNLGNSKLKEEEIKELLIQFKPIFIHLNDNNIIHRDIKPDNILIKYNEANKIIYKLSDFSLAKYLRNSSNSLFGGCIGYMSPQIIDKVEYTNKTDIYSLGATIYYLLFGETPSMKNVLTQKFDKLPNDENLKDLLQKMLKYEEKDRISWDELINHPFLSNQIEILEG